MNQHEYSVTDDGWVSFRTVRPEPGRKYFNHMAEHTRGAWHRHWLLTSGQYIKTSDPDAGRLKVVGEPGPELVNFRNSGHIYPPPHHRGSAADVENHWPGCGHPLSPDCRGRANCHKCDGQAWNDETDALASCGCTCHLEPTH